VIENLPASLASGTGRLALLEPDGAAVIDAVRLRARDTGTALGRDPADPRSWRRLNRPTPGTSNAPQAAAPVVIHEIHYHPPSERDDDEFLELHNPGNTAVSLSGWRFVDGVDFTFPQDAALAAGDYAVVVPDRARFLELHPNIPAHRIHGPYRGNLSDAGERLALARPADPEPAGIPADLGAGADRPMIVVEEVTYRDGGRWGRWSDGGGSSLELVTLREDPRDAASWADSDESMRASWTTLESSGVLGLAHSGVPQANQLQVMLLGAGEALLDDVEVLVNGVNRIANSTFRNGSAGWFAQGTHRPSRLESSEGFDDGASFRLIATDRGDHVANRVRNVLTSPIANGTTVTIRARVRWLRGHPEILLRLNNGSLEAAGRLDLPRSTGTPAAPNSRTRPNLGPAITEVRHDPLLPRAGQPVRVTARIRDIDGLTDAQLLYRLDPQTQLTRVPMTDDGSGADEIAGDGLFTGEFPGRSTGTLVAYRITATDGAPSTLGGPLTATYPADAPDREALVRFGEPATPSGFGTYRIWMTRAAHDRWAAREKMSNEDLPVTFVSDTGRIIHGAGAHYSGSSYTAPTYTTPTGSLCGYNLSLPEDEPFLGATHLTLDWPIRDDTNQREQLMYWFLEQLDLPNMHRRYVHVVVNGVRRGTIYDDVEQPGRDTVSAWFGDDDQGSLWKTDCWNEFDNSGNRIDPCILNTLQRFPTSGPLKTARYRWNWRPRAVRGSANDFTDLFGLVNAANATSSYLTTVESVVDVDHWMRTFAMNDLASFWDAFGNPNAKNTFLYKPEHDRWKLMSWDFDVGLGVFNDPPEAPLFEVGDPAIQRMYRTPAFVRRYWAALQESLDTFFRVGTGTRIDQRLDARYAAFRSHGVALASPTGIKSWITQRRSFLQRQLNSVRAPFTITTQSGMDFTTDQESLDLKGTAPVGVRWIALNGTVREPTWTTVSNWTIQLTLRPGTNVLQVTGLDRRNAPVPGASDTLTVVYSGSSSAPPLLRLNEWMASNQSTIADPADGDFEDWFEILNAGDRSVDLTGFTLSDDPADPQRFLIPAGFVLPPGGLLLVWADGEPGQTGPGTGLHTSFRLDRSGSALLLSDPWLRVVDAVRFGPQTPDVSEGRWPDGSRENLAALVRPTPGTSNAEPTPQRIELSVRGVSVAGIPNVEISWLAIPGQRYRLEFREDWSANFPWRSTQPDITAQEPRVTFREPVATETGAARYFRVRKIELR
jgi:hypothetical protein